MRRPHDSVIVPLIAVDRIEARGWNRWLAGSLPLLAAAVLLTLGGCASMSGSASQSPAGSPEAAPGAAPAVLGGNLWTPRMEGRREAVVRAGTGHGVSVVRTTDNQLKLIVPMDAAFEPGRSELKPALRPVLDEVARGLDDPVRVTIVGHTDSASGDAVNGPLSQDRAESVREYLVQHGVRRGRLLVEGRGGRQPVASNATEAGRAANRRIEIFLSQPAS
ncbi:OmpA family protein [Roseateles sp. So40a]|uniref:OmpA family protein n=1 Tax=Roseateles sp. So40a TaxID=3400226 RepID=UPI003A85E9EE